ncbi:multidrug efflux transcriptional repressor AxyZ [Achromobacter sp. Marseille-Q0513]|uniref:multidrug efflux transcriptional repressor AxyZ n=1 Tax=Achromobacter sp. Marseille-Q0513 TaxID=2829161 RepID=UPI001B968555|nr:multidrug efflux transcriptional repressor AxyZ [Achromobacter sp. Marseille-Q0513]MBR8653099.1 multidrug efflux transcriptional repressor AxyZ [Achromobacter sp. Marseille-Q0513]
MARKTKEESQRTRDRILDAAEHVFMSKGVANTTMGDIADHAGVSRGAVYGHYKNKIDVCVAMSDRALAAAVALTRIRTDGKALESLYASMLQYVRIYSEEGSMQRVLEILYDKCEQSDENAPLLRRRDIWERHALRNSERLLRAAVRNEDLPGALDVRLSNVYLHSLIEGVFGSICWSDRLKGDIWPRVERMLRAAIDTLRFSPHLRLAQAA